MSDARAAGALQLTFPEGWVGYPEWRRFTLHDAPEGGPVALLQSLDDADLYFMVTIPALVHPGFRLDVPPATRALLQLVPDQEPATLCLLVLRDDPPALTANLLGPIVYNAASGLACQLVLNDAEYSARHPVALPEELVEGADASC